jgi:hypothetical protein
MKVRLLMRTSIADYEGKFVGYDYKTYVVTVDDNIFNNPKNLPEIIGGEWLEVENGIEKVN